jgi:hypothetical protein
MMLPVLESILSGFGALRSRPDLSMSNASATESCFDVTMS